MNINMNNGEITTNGTWTDVAGIVHDKYIARSFHVGSEEPCETYTKDAAIFLLWLIDQRDGGKKFRG